MTPEQKQNLIIEELSNRMEEANANEDNEALEALSSFFDWMMDNFN